MSIKKILISILLIIATVVGSVIFFFKTKTSTTTDNYSDQSSDSSDQKNVDKTVSNPLNLQKLSVLPQKCIGCGKCARIDSEHFEMNGRVAIVISSTNLNSSNLKMAINNCPAQAIALK